MKLTPGQVAKMKAMLMTHLGITPEATERWAKHRQASPQMAQDGQNGAADDEVLIYGVICDDADYEMYGWMFGNAVICPSVFKERLGKIDGKATLRINSPGGSFYACAAMVTLIDERGDVNAKVDGVAASAASAVMAACGNVKVGALGTVMIHAVRVVAAGTASELEKGAKVIRSMTRQAASLYARRMEGKAKDIAELLEEDQYYTAEEAKEVGLVDEVMEPKKNKGDDDVDPKAFLEGQKASEEAMAASMMI